METPLLSFVITSYKNHKYIYEAVDSVLEQDYPRIQLIFSDDGSGDFDTEALQSYLDEHAGDNIKDIQIYAHDTNRGTVQNMEFCRQKCDGEYIMYMAADDALNGPNVLSRYVAEFERLGDDALVVCSKVAMCGENLNNIQSYEPSEEGIHYICDLTPQELFGRMSHTWTIPTTSCCYRKEVYGVVGAYDTDYFIMEDGPLFMKLARNGHRIHWIDDMIAARHRGGGISHGNTLNLSESYRKYRYDEIIYFQKEVLPYKKMLQKKDLEPMMFKWRYVESAYFNTFIAPNLKAIDVIRYNLKHFPQYCRGVLHRTKNMAVQWLKNVHIYVSLFILCVLGTMGYLILPYFMSAASFAVAFIKSCKILAWSCGALVGTMSLIHVVVLLIHAVKYIIMGRE